jgi:16S rRNA (guanine527-N7)-methyltransferase
VEPPEEDIPAQNEGLRALLLSHGIEVNDEQVDLLDRYRGQLWSWNERLNLTRHTTLEKFVSRDLLDSFELSKLLEQGERVLDVGTGGGVPGVVVAILRPDLSISLCESTQKKARAVESIVTDLGLPIRVYPNRAEEVLEITTFDTLIARALAPLPKILGWLRPHWEAFDRLLLIKGRSWVDERNEARHAGLLTNLELRKAAAYSTPGNDAESVVLSLTSKGFRD